MLASNKAVRSGVRAGMSELTSGKTVLSYVSVYAIVRSRNEEGSVNCSAEFGVQLAGSASSKCRPMVSAVLCWTTAASDSAVACCSESNTGILLNR